MLTKNYINIFYIIKIFFIAFVFNFIWENLHFTLYLSNNIGINNHLSLMIYASFIDAFFIFIMFIFLGLINKNINWSLNIKNLLLFSFLLLVVSLIIELRALSVNRWTYGADMPLLFGVGLSPLFQLAITGIGSVFTAKLKFIKH